jgi:hypothetical protein
MTEININAVVIKHNSFGEKNEIGGTEDVVVVGRSVNELSVYKLDI